MISHNIRTYVSASLWLAFGTYIAIFLIAQDLGNIDLAKAISYIPTTISINAIFWGMFIKWLWKLKLFYPWLVQIPNLSGKWSGEIISSWEGSITNPIQFELTINQTLLNIQVKIKTSESVSSSVAASFDIDKDRGLQQLFYSFLNTPKPDIRDRSQIHYGTTLLKFDGFDVAEMSGEYWTSRKTGGEIHLKKVQNNN